MNETLPALLLAGLLASPNPPAPPPASAGLVAIHAGRLVDVDKGEVVRDRWIVIEG